MIAYHHHRELFEGYSQLAVAIPKSVPGEIVKDLAQLLPPLPQVPMTSVTEAVPPKSLSSSFHVQ